MNRKLIKQLLLMTLLPLSLCLHMLAFAAGFPPAVDAAHAILSSDVGT